MARRGYIGFALGLAIGLASRAGAVDGVIEINQARAEAGFVTAVDDPGFPVILASSGSYRLTGDLTVSDPNQSAVVISAAHVQLDLNGFTVRGPNTLADGIGTCTADGSGSGIMALGAGTSVLNGRVVGFGAVGVALSEPGGRVERVIAEQHCGPAFVLNTALVRNSTARLNSGDGFNLAASSRISGCIADRNSRGIVAGGRTIIERCVVTANLFEGILGNESTLIRRNQVNDNGTTGIVSPVGSSILDNVINGHQTGIVGATQAAAQVGSGGNVVTYAPSSGGYFYVQQLYCSFDNGLKLCP